MYLAGHAGGDLLERLTVGELLIFFNEHQERLIIDDQELFPHSLHRLHDKFCSSREKDDILLFKYLVTRMTSLVFLNVGQLDVLTLPSLGRLVTRTPLQGGGTHQQE